MQAHTTTDLLWLLFCAVLIFCMQAGFCCLESGLVRAKNSINVAIKNMADFCIAGMLFWAVGFGLMFGASRMGLVGTSHFFFDGGQDAWLTTFFLFQLMFCGAATTIISGAVAERLRFAGYLVIAALVSGLLYPVFGGWVWNGVDTGVTGGWLRSLGFLDFAGATVVHALGGWVALAAILVLGPRLGRFDPEQPPIRGQSMPTAALGVLLLWVGWCGFNGGSTLAMSDAVPSILVNTMLAGIFGGSTAMVLSWRLFGRPDVAYILSGSLAGLVAITAGPDMVASWAAALIGIGGGVCFCGATSLLQRWRIDDAIGAVPVHCAGGIWGCLSLALLGDPSRFPGGAGRLEQLAVQGLGVAVAFVWGFGLSYLLLRAINRYFPLRVSAEAEFIGLNVAEHDARDDLFDLLDTMETQRRRNDFSERVDVEPHTEVGRIAAQYNRVLDQVNAEAREHEAALRALHREAGTLELARRIAHRMNDGSDFDAVIRYSLAEICTWTGWEIGGLYLRDEEQGGIPQRTDLWHDADPVRFSALVEALGRSDAQSALELPGRVLREGTAQWSLDLRFEDGYATLGFDAVGMPRAVFDFPVFVDGDVAAVLEFYCTEDSLPDAYIFDLMAHVADQLGPLIARWRRPEMPAVGDGVPPSHRSPKSPMKHALAMAEPPTRALPPGE